MILYFLSYILICFSFKIPFALWNRSDYIIFLFQDWPEQGVVKFNNYSTRYREGLDLVVKNIDCNISGGEKVRIFIFVIVNGQR